MKWPGIRERIRANLCDELRKRADFHITKFKETLDGAYDRAWITVDGERVSSGTPGYSASEFIPLLSDYLSLPPSEALRDELPLWRALAVADRRLGKTTLESFVSEKEPDEVVRLFFALRMGKP